jgi:hypothetical protein
MEKKIDVASLPVPEEPSHPHADEDHPVEFLSNIFS